MNQREIKLLQDLCTPRRGERAFSIVDLIQKKTIPLDLAAFLASKVARGASWIVCSGPGGVGKTTTMRSLLPFAPADRRLGLALPNKVLNLRFEQGCLISNELSDHPPPTYLWDQDLRDFFELGSRGHQIVGNMHVDHLDQARSEVVDVNGVPERHFRSVNLFLFLRLRGHGLGRGRVDGSRKRRFVQEVYYTDGALGHERVYTARRGLLPDAPGDEAHETMCADFLQDALTNRKKSTIELRQRFAGWASDYATEY